MKAALTYYLFEGILTGLAADRVFHLTALSGGGGGTTRSKPTAATNNPYAEGLKTHIEFGKHIHGGPIPPGIYLIKLPKIHPHLGLCCPTGTSRLASHGT